MKQFTRIEPTTVQEVGNKFKNMAVIKTFHTEDGMTHEFTTWGEEGVRSGAVLALTPDNQVITTYEFRAGPERWMYELPGGKFNPKEDVQTAALRELKEETGYVPDQVAYLGETCRDAYLNPTWFYFFATGCQLSPEGQSLDEEEKAQGVEVRLISVSELIENAMNNKMTDPAAVLMAYDKLLKIAGH
jgi:ADP-ribose pyrophosphatase